MSRAPAFWLASFAMAAALSATACAKESSTEDDSNERLAGERVASPELGAHVRTQQRAAPTPVARHAPSAHAPSQPLDAASLQQRLVAYAASLRETTDASQDAFAKAMKITLTPFEPGRPGGEAENQAMADGYAFYASYVGLAAGMKVPYHGVSVFRPGGKPLTEDPHAPCFWTSAAAGKALLASGYTRGGERAFQRGRLQQYHRTSSDGGTVFYADLLTYSAGAPAHETCVYEVQFTGDVP